MMSRIAACSRMTWLVIGTLRAFTTSDSRRSTRNCMSNVTLLPRRHPTAARPKAIRQADDGSAGCRITALGSATVVAQEQQRLLADLLHAQATTRLGHFRLVLVYDSRDGVCHGRQRAHPMRVRERRLKDRDVRERRVAENDVVRSRERPIQESQYVRGDDLGAVIEARRCDVLPERPECFGRTLDEH